MVVEGLITGLYCVFLLVSSCTIVFQGRSYWVHLGDSELLRTIYYRTRIFLGFIASLLALCFINGLTVVLIRVSPLDRRDRILGTAALL